MNWQFEGNEFVTGRAWRHLSRRNTLSARFLVWPWRVILNINFSAPLHTNPNRASLVTSMFSGINNNDKSRRHWYETGGVGDS